MTSKLRVLLADDHRVIRQGLRALLEDEPDVEVIAEAEDGRSAVRMATELAPDVVVMDISMPDLNGIEATRQICAGGGGATPRVIALSAHDDRRFTTEMLRAGASGYVSKVSAFEELATALRAVAAGEVYLSPVVAKGVVGDLLEQDGAVRGFASAFNKLSPREREVLQLIAEGKATKEVARHLQVSVKTIETHRRKVMEKLDLYSVAELTKYAVREGLTSVEQ